MGDDRSAQFRNKNRYDESMKRRDNVTIQLRKIKRGSQLTKRRQISGDLITPPSNCLDDLHMHTERILVDNPCDVFPSVRYYRYLLMPGPDPPIDLVLNSGALPKLVSFLSMDSLPELQCEVIWVIAILASGTNEQTTVLVNMQVIPILMRLICSLDSRIVEQTIFALGNIGGDCSLYRDNLLNMDLLPKLVSIVKNNPINVPIVRNAIWCISNLCRGKSPKPQYDLLKPAVPLLFSYLNVDTDLKLLTDACRSFSFLTGGDFDKLVPITTVMLATNMVNLMSHQDTQVLSAVLRTLGNILTGTDRQTQMVLDCGLLPVLTPHLISSNKNNKTMKREALWCLSNIAAGNRSQIKSLFDTGVIPSVISFLVDASILLRKESAWSIYNLLSGGDVNQIQELVKMNCIPSICSLLTNFDPKLILLGLNCISKILKSGTLLAHLQHVDINPYVELVDSCQGLRYIERLQNHQIGEINITAFSITDQYFAEMDDVVFGPQD